MRVLSISETYILMKACGRKPRIVLHNTIAYIPFKRHWFYASAKLQK